MLTEIQLENYRGFSKHDIPLRPISIIVGRNNSGKTTIIEALTLISIVVSRAQHSRFVPPPDWLTVPTAIRGVSPSLRGIDFEFRNLCHQYSEELRNEVFDKISIEIGMWDRQHAANANPEARKLVDEAWSTYEGMISICPGKQIVSALSTWSQKNYQVSFSALGIARNMLFDEIPHEIFRITGAIEKLADFKRE